MFSILRPYIFSLDPEVAHDLAIKSLKVNILPLSFFGVEEEELLETKLFNKRIKNPIGLAAGFDKSGEVYNSLFKLGYGFVEVGTVTPKKQLGNPKPRIFRLEKESWERGDACQRSILCHVDARFIHEKGTRRWSMDFNVPK